MTDPFCRAFVVEVRRRLHDDYLWKIDKVLARLDEEGLWWRPHEGANAIGNLLLHLAGNLRQWVIHGAGGARDVRVRDAEFAARDGHTKAELRALVATTIEEALAVVERLPDEAWLEPRTIQGYRETVLSAVFHAVEHFSGHVGQILTLAKLRDLAFPPIYGADGSGGP